MKKKARYVGDEATAPTTRTYYVNDKWQVVDGTTGEEIELPDNVRLPQYDEEGNRYAYTMVEQSITMMGPDGENKITIKLDPDGTPSEDNEEKAVAFYESIFTDAKVTEGTFQATNVYNDEQNGRLAVKKWLNVGELKEGDALSTVRGLAKDLRISIITTGRAYRDLERDGFIVTAVGRGSFVAGISDGMRREEKLKEAETLLAEAAEKAALAGLGKEEFVRLAAELFGGEE